MLNVLLGCCCCCGKGTDEPASLWVNRQGQPNKSAEIGRSGCLGANIGGDETNNDVSHPIVLWGATAARFRRKNSSWSIPRISHHFLRCLRHRRRLGQFYERPRDLRSLRSQRSSTSIVKRKRPTQQKSVSRRMWF